MMKKPEFNNMTRQELRAYTAVPAVVRYIKYSGSDCKK